MRAAGRGSPRIVEGSDTPVYKIRFILNGRKARWITGAVASRTEAMSWFKAMLAENYSLSNSQVESTAKTSSMTDVTSTCPNGPKTLYIPEGKMFKFGGMRKGNDVARKNRRDEEIPRVPW